MAAISWITRKTITHKQRHAFKITLLEVGQRKRYKRVLKTSCPCTNRWIWLRRSQPFSHTEVVGSANETVAYWLRVKYGIKDKRSRKKMGKVQTTRPTTRPLVWPKRQQASKNTFTTVQDYQRTYRSTNAKPTNKGDKNLLEHTTKW